MEQRDFFISYTHSDEAEAVWIARTLKEHGYSVYIQAWDSPLGDSFVTWINDAIVHSNNFIAVWSEAYSKSGHCRGEIEAEYTRKVKGVIGCFLPVCIENYGLEPLYQRYGRVDIFNLYDNEKKQKLLWAVSKAINESDVICEKETYEQPTSQSNSYVVIKKDGLGKSLFFLVALWIFLSITQIRLWIRCIIWAIVAVDQLSDKIGLVSCALGDLSLDSQCYSLAWKYYRQAAKLGHARSLCALGYMFQHGMGVDIDFCSAKIYYQMSAKKGFYMALYNIGYLYELGAGVTRDYAMALKYYQDCYQIISKKENLFYDSDRKKFNRKYVRVLDAIARVSEKARKE